MNPCGNDKCNEINAGIDACIQSLVDALNNSGFTTVASCCGHGKTNGNIALKDGRELIIAPDYATAREIERHFPDIHGEASSRSPAGYLSTWTGKKPTKGGMYAYRSDNESPPILVLVFLYGDHFRFIPAESVAWPGVDVGVTSSDSEWSGPIRLER